MDRTAIAKGCAAAAAPAALSPYRLPTAALPSPPRPPVQLMIPAEAAHDTVSALGEVGMLQFKDLNAERNAFQRTYANQVRRGLLVAGAGAGWAGLGRAGQGSREVVGWPGQASL